VLAGSYSGGVVLTFSVFSGGGVEESQRQIGKKQKKSAACQDVLKLKRVFFILSLRFDNFGNLNLHHL